MAVRSTRYRFSWHAWVRAGHAEPSRILERESARLPFLARKLVEEPEIGERIFVRIPDFHVREDGLHRLVALMQDYGLNLLLFVARADARGAPGTVQQISPGLLRGYISHFADPTNIPYTIPSAEWLTLCRAARELVPIRARAQAWMTCCVDVMVQPPHVPCRTCRWRDRDVHRAKSSIDSVVTGATS
jgi:hypothetical protein